MTTAKLFLSRYLNAKVLSLEYFVLFGINLSSTAYVCMLPPKSHLKLFTFDC